jgi:predicted amidophosphoribosyltransferase
MTALDLLLPPSCAGCDRPGTPCCATCLDDFGPPQRIQVPGVGPPVWTLAAYRGAARELVLAFKERGARALVAWFGAMVAAGRGRGRSCRLRHGAAPLVIEAATTC